MTYLPILLCVPSLVLLVIGVKMALGERANFVLCIFSCIGFMYALGRHAVMRGDKLSEVCAFVAVSAFWFFMGAIIFFEEPLDDSDKG